MGNFGESVSKLVNWIGDIITSVIDWFNSIFRKKVEERTEKFLIKNEKKILSSQEPKKVGKIAGQQKAIIELQKITEEEKKDLSKSDLETIDSMFENEDFDV